MKEIERRYLRSAYHHFNKKFPVFKTMFVDETAFVLKDYLIFQECILEILSINDWSETSFLDELFKENNINLLC